MVRLTQAGFEQVSKLFEELSLEFENAKQSMKEIIIAELSEGTDFNQENCEENNENDITGMFIIFIYNLFIPKLLRQQHILSYNNTLVRIFE